MCAQGGCGPVQRHSASGDSSGTTPGWNKADRGNTEHQVPGRKHTGRVACLLPAPLSFQICMQELWEYITAVYSFHTLNIFTFIWWEPSQKSEFKSTSALWHFCSVPVRKTITVAGCWWTYHLVHMYPGGFHSLYNRPLLIFCSVVVISKPISFADWPGYKVCCGPCVRLLPKNCPSQEPNCCGGYWWKVSGRCGKCHCAMFRHFSETLITFCDINGPCNLLL